MERIIFLPRDRVLSGRGVLRHCPPTPTPGRGERRIWGPGLGTRGKCGGCRMARGQSARRRVQSVHVVGVWRFHSNFGSLGSGVSEGVTNQSREPGINYANHHLAMGQMTPLL